MKTADTLNLFSQNVREFREAGGLSQVELSRLCGYGDNWISRVEGGAIGISADALEAISKALGIEPKDLISAKHADGDAPEVKKLRARVRSLESENAEKTRLLEKLSSILKDYR